MTHKKQTISRGNLPEDFDYDRFRQEVITGLIEGKTLTGESGLLQPLIADFVQGALDAELQDHLNNERAEGISNRRNGRQSKMIRSESGEVEIVYDRDRNSTFDSITIKKRQHQLGVGFDNQILALYAMSNSIADIRTHLEKMYGVQMWEKDWDELMACIDLPIALRKITYTTNAIENLNRKIRRVTKTKGAWV